MRSMEYIQQFNPQFTQVDQASQENQSTGRFLIPRSRSIELRAGKLYPTCDCIKRNGLQHECQRIECQLKSSCMTTSGHSCNSSGFAQKLASCSMGSGNGFNRRQCVNERDVKIHTLGDANPMKSGEASLTNDPVLSEDFSEIKDFDPKMFAQIYQGVASSQVPFNQFCPVSMMNQPIATYPRNFAGIPVSQPSITIQPQMTSSSKSGANPKTGNQNSINQAVTHSMPVYPGMLAPISAIEPMPTIHQFSGSSSFQSATPLGQPCPIPGQAFTSFNGSVNSFNPYSPNVPSYLPCGPATMPSVSAGIPVGTAP